MYSLVYSFYLISFKFVISVGLSWIFDWWNKPNHLYSFLSFQYLFILTGWNCWYSSFFHPTELILPSCKQCHFYNYRIYKTTYIRMVLLTPSTSCAYFKAHNYTLHLLRKRPFSRRSLFQLFTTQKWWCSAEYVMHLRTRWRPDSNPTAGPLPVSPIEHANTWYFIQNF